MQYQQEIDHMVKIGCALDDVERWIDNQPIFDPEERAALWLYAWLTLPRVVEHREVEDLVYA